MKTSPTQSHIILPEDLEEFKICKDCLKEEIKMSVPQAAFAAFNVRNNMEKMDNHYNCKQEASNYNSKYMNSIWGMYNRFSVHNLKKVMDFNKPQPIGQNVKGLVQSSQLSVSMEKLSYLPL